MSKNLGFIVMECCLDFEQGLAIIKGQGLPQDGVLAWREKTQAIAVFETRKQASQAINRTEHYRLAFGHANWPEKQHCKIVSVRAAQ